jgi:hypothetical protein
MTATDAINVARHAGIELMLDGDDLVLEAPAPPPPIVLDLLSRHKAEVVAILSATAHDNKLLARTPISESVTDVLAADARGNTSGPTGRAQTDAITDQTGRGSHGIGVQGVASKSPMNAIDQAENAEPSLSPNRHLVEVPDRFAVARWSRDAAVATIARSILGTLKYEPHTADTTVLRHALEGVIKHAQSLP